MAAHALGRLPEALEHARAARIGFNDHANQPEAWTHASVAARILDDMGEHAQALAEAEAVLADVADKGGWSDSYEGAMHLHHVLSPRGDSRASALLATAYQGLSAMAERFADQVPRDIYMRSDLLAREICDAWAAAQAAQHPLTSEGAAS